MHHDIFDFSLFYRLTPFDDFLRRLFFIYGRLIYLFSELSCILQVVYISRALRFPSSVTLLHQTIMHVHSYSHHHLPIHIHCCTS